MTKLDKLADWVRSHGNTCAIVGSTLHIDIELVERDGSITIVVEKAKTLKKAREILGY